MMCITNKSRGDGINYYIMSNGLHYAQLPCIIFFNGFIIIINENLFINKLKCNQKKILDLSKISTLYKDILSLFITCHIGYLQII